MKFENKGKWVRQINESLTNKNEVRYINPDNLDRYNPDEIEEVTTASGEKRYKRKQFNSPAEKSGAEDSVKQLTVDSFDDIPDRNQDSSNAWRKAGDKGQRAYDRAVLDILSSSKPEEYVAHTNVKNLIETGLDGMAIDWIKDHYRYTITQEVHDRLKDLDKAFQEKDIDKSREAYLAFWDAFRNATKRKRNK